MPTSGADWPMQYETVKSQRTRATSTDFHSSNSAAFNKVSTDHLKCPKCPKCPSAGLMDLLPKLKKKKPMPCTLSARGKTPEFKTQKKNAKRNAERIWKTPKDAKRCQKQIELQRMKPPRMAKRCCLSFTWRYPLKTRAICEDSPPSMGNEVMMGSITCNVQQLKQLKQLKDRLQLLKGSEGIWRDLKGSEGYGFVHLLVTGLSL